MKKTNFAPKKWANNLLGGGLAKWSKWKIIPPINIPSLIESIVWEAAVNADGRLEIFVASTNGNILHSWQFEPNGDWSDWHNLGNPGVGVGRQMQVTSNQDGSLVLFSIGVNKHLYHIRQTQPNDGWSSWYDLGVLPWKGGTYAYEIGNPAVVLNRDGRLEYLMGNYSMRQLYHIYQTEPNGPWSNWSSLQEMPIIDSITVGVNEDGRLEMFGYYFFQSDRKIVHSWQRSDGTWIGEWQSLGAPDVSDPYDSFSTIVLSNKDGRLELFVNSTNGREIFHRWQEVPNGHWNPEWIKLGNIGGGYISWTAGALSDGRLLYASFRLDGKIHFINQDKVNDGWIDSWQSNAWTGQ